jgi:hypothetical protein
MANWTTSWQTLSKEPPNIPSIDVSNKSKLKANKNDKKLITKENSQQVLNNSKTNKSFDSQINNKRKDNQKDIGIKDNQKDIAIKDKSINEKPIDSQKHSINERKDVINDTKSPNDKSLIYSKLRKRKIPQIQYFSKTDEKPINNNCTEDKNSETITLSNTESKPIDEVSQNSEINVKIEQKVNQSEDNVMEVEDNLNDNQLICIRKDCNKRVHKFFIFENKFCSSDCAIAQWTDDFHKTWGQKTL